jgi:epsilon-lactone hydrolase
MASWQARWVGRVVEWGVRQAARGDPERLLRHARRLVDAPNPLQWAWTRRVRIEPVRQGPVRGEWVTGERADRGVVLYLHGGGYVAGSPASHRPITAALARLSGRRVLGLRYRLAPADPFPAALDDAVSAYRWLLEQGPSSALTLAGDSAGGGLLLAALVRARDEGLPAAAAAVCFSPWTDLTATSGALRRPDGRAPVPGAATVAALARLYLGEVSATDPYASPVFADLGGLPPLLFQVGSTEILLDDTLRVHTRIQAAGGSSTLHVFEGVFHAWQLLDGLVPEARLALREAAEFLNAQRPTAGTASSRGPCGAIVKGRCSEGGR